METNTTFSTIGFLAGGALLVAGAWLLLSNGPSDVPRAAPVAVVPDIGPTSSGAMILGAF
jgi:hypothetical protein